MARFKRDDVSLFYEVSGSGEPIVLIHGFSVDSTVWRGLISFLEPQFKVITLDLRGSGQTEDDGVDLSIHQFAKDVADLLEHLEIPKAHILGHSMGGMIAQQFGLDYPERVFSLGLLNSLVKLTYSARRHFDGMLLLREQHGIQPMDLRLVSIARVFSDSFLASDANIELLKELMLANPYPQSLADFKRQYQALLAFDSSKQLAKLTAPILVITGAEDMLTPAAKMREAAAIMPKATYIEQEKMGHASPVEAPEWVAKQFMQFLQQATNQSN